MANRRKTKKASKKRWSKLTRMPVKKVRYLRLREPHPWDVTGIPVFDPTRVFQHALEHPSHIHLGALTRGGIVTSPTGQTFRLSPGPVGPRTVGPRAVYANRRPGTVYDADADGWIAREDAESGFPADEDRVDPPEFVAERLHAESGEWGARAVEVAARMRADRSRRARPARFAAQRCGDAQKMIGAIRGALYGSNAYMHCNEVATADMIRAQEAANQGKCVLAKKFVKRAAKFCKRGVGQNYNYSREQGY